jgi:N-acetylmuramoyl-L-alanine amidase
MMANWRVKGGMVAKSAAVALVLASAPGFAQGPSRPAVTAVRAAEHEGGTRVVLELSAPVSFQLATDSDARHLGVALPELDWRADAHQMNSAGVGLVRQISFAIPGHGAGRLQLDTNRPAVIHKMFLMPPSAGGNYRLVLDLEATTGGANTAIAASAIPAKPEPVPAPAPAAKLQTAATTPAPVPEHKERHSGKPIVMLDAGHGGVDPGATSVSGAYEKNIVLALARDIKEELDKGGKVNCQLTRDRDIFIPLRDRVAIARAANADLFMSIHADTVADSDIHGLSVYTLSQNASDAEAQALADKENKSDIVAGLDLSNESPEVTNILIDLVQRESMNLSASFAHKVITEVEHNTHQLLQNTHRFAGFAVLKAPDVPSVLVESGYLSNERDEQMLRKPEYRAKLAQALARAIESFLAKPRNQRRV